MDDNFINTSYRIGMREPAILIPDDQLPPVNVIYYADDTSLPIAKDEVAIKNVLNTPTQTLTIEKEKLESMKNEKSGKGIIFAAMAAIAGYFYISK